MCSDSFDRRSFGEKSRRLITARAWHDVSRRDQHSTTRASAVRALVTARPRDPLSDSLKELCWHSKLTTRLSAWRVSSLCSPSHGQDVLQHRDRTSTGRGRRPKLTRAPQLLKRKGGYATIWIAATLGAQGSTKKLSKREIVGTDLVKAAERIIEPDEPLALRLSASLMFGVVRVRQLGARLVYLMRCVALPEAAAALHRRRRACQPAHQQGPC